MFNIVFPRGNLPRIKDIAYIINLDNKQRSSRHWVSLFINKNTTGYFDYFRIEYIPQDVLNKFKDTSVINNVFGIRSDNPIMCVFYCIAFIEYSEC